jgi:hypothetical protein
MRNPRRVVNIALIVVAIIAVGAGVIAARSGGRSSASGNAQACNAFWSWDDSTGATAPVLSAYQKATTQPLKDDLYDVSVGLRDQGKGLNGDKQANTALAQQYASKAEADCTNAGYPDPAT